MAVPLKLNWAIIESFQDKQDQERTHITDGRGGGGTLAGKTMTHKYATIQVTINKASRLELNRLIINQIVTRYLERLWFLNKIWLHIIIVSGYGAIDMKLQQILEKFTVQRDCGVITEQTSHSEITAFPWCYYCT